MQNWFSNRRASEKAAWRATPGCPAYNPTADYSDVFVESRRLKIRNVALELSPAWDDRWFVEVLMITNIRLLALRVQQEDKETKATFEEEKKRKEAASALMMLCKR